MSIKKIEPLFLIIGILLLIACFLWLLGPSSQPRFSNIQITIVSLGQLFGIIGVLLFSINIILATRFKFLDRYFRGLSNIYKQHSRIGQIGFILLLFHPFFLIPKYSTSIQEAARFLWLSRDWAINWGILALWGMLVFIVLTLFLRPKYNIWKWTHKFFGLALLLAALHVWMTPSNLSTFAPLQLYILTFIILGIAASLYKSVLEQLLVKTTPYTVNSTQQLTPQVTKNQCHQSTINFNILQANISLYDSQTRT